MKICNCVLLNAPLLLFNDAVNLHLVDGSFNNVFLLCIGNYVSIGLPEQLER